MKVGFVTVLGKTNVGKSTLLNTIMKRNFFIVSSKPQTTRHRIIGVLNLEDAQIAFVDTPGIFEPKNELEKAMAESIKFALVDADIFYYMIDVYDLEIDEGIFKKIKDKTKFLLINKIDKVEKNIILPIIDKFKDYGFDEIIPVSALKNQNIDDLLETTKKYLPEGERLFLPDQISDRPVQFFIAEFIREKLYFVYGQEIPYSCAVEIEEFRDNFIKANIIVEKDSQKGIIIGKDGERIKKVGILARESIEHFLGKKIYLELWVKVKKNWRKDAELVRRLGYYE
uniref:GTPase Era n=1 Tax=candidate division WOR-3 bacterium TaxID=2052148 RepID=A0A7C4YHY8_UNCW3